VSPFRPSFLQPPVVRPANNRLSTLLFSASSELLFPQLLSFHNHLRCPLFFLSMHSASRLRLLLSLNANSLVFSGLAPLLVSCLSFSHSSHLFSSACSLFSQNTGGGVGSLCESSAPQRYPFLSVVPPFPVSQSAQRGRLPHIQVSLLQAQGSQVNG
jgi:hypothetical protein